jgi:hypothetical protein
MEQFIGFFIDPTTRPSVSTLMIKLIQCATFALVLASTPIKASVFVPMQPFHASQLLASPAKSAADNMNDFAPKPPMVKPITKKLKCKKRFILLQGICRPQYG